jgi:nucleotide-binding universal stress UspA family protein
MFEATTKGASMGTPFTDILVPLDGSPAAERALIPALRLARRTGVPLRMLSRALPDELDRFTDYLAGVATVHATEADIETLVVDRESIPDAIAKGVERGTLVCLSSHGRGGLTRAVMGSVAEALLRTLDQPALVVGPYVTEDVALAGRIVACVDGSAESERTLQPAKEWSAALGLPCGWWRWSSPERPPSGRGTETRSSPVTLRRSHAGWAASRAGTCSTTGTRPTLWSTWWHRRPNARPCWSWQLTGGRAGIACASAASPRPRCTARRYPCSSSPPCRAGARPMLGLAGSGAPSWCDKRRQEGVVRP